MLADHQIRYEIEEGGDIYVSPYNPTLVQPASLDMRLGTEFIRYIQSDTPLDPTKPDSTQWVKFEADRLVIRPGEFILATTMEWVAVGPKTAARVEGKSTLGRLGLIVHSTAGFVDPGFKGNITLEMTNINVRPIILQPGMRICQMAFYRMDAKVERAYGDDRIGSHYNNQSGVTAAAPLTSKVIQPILKV